MKEDREKKSLKKKNWIWMCFLFFRFFFIVYFVKSLYVDLENLKRSNIIINVFICIDFVVIVILCCWFNENIGFWC